MREFFTVQWSEGFRPGEAGMLTWGDVDLRQRLVKVRQSKDKARVGREIGLADDAYKVLRAMSDEAKPLPTARIFGNRTGRAPDFRATLAKAVRAAGVAEKITPHLFRHFRLSELGGKTRDVGALQYFAGHKHLSTTDKYVRSRTERTEKMLREADRRK